MTPFPDDHEDLSDDRAEFKPRKPKRYHCLDRLCGALDCTNCYPDQRENEELEGETDED
jgi:hypothetical protein